MFPALDLEEGVRLNKGERRKLLADRALADLESWRARCGLSDDGAMQPLRALDGSLEPEPA
jgi:hypothetical protein